MVFVRFVNRIMIMMNESTQGNAKRLQPCTVQSKVTYYMIENGLFKTSYSNEP